MASNELGIDRLDMFDTFPRHRSLLHYLRNHSDTKNELMEEIIRVVTQMHEVAKERLEVHEATYEFQAERGVKSLTEDVPWIQIWKS